MQKYKEELRILEEMAREQGNQLNFSYVMRRIPVLGEDFSKLRTYFEEKGIEFLHTDVEPELVNDNIIREDIIEPFNPGDINILMDKMTMDSVVKRLENEEFELDSDFQRKAGLWTDVQKSQLIESIFLRIPLPAFYFDATNDDKWIIIDGLQRIYTIKQFVVDRTLCLKGTEFWKDLDGKAYEELPRSLQRRLMETNINAYLVKPPTPINVKFNIFKRINTGGLVLEAQEIRNALFQGPSSPFLRELSELQIFLEVTGGSIPKDRMLDREFCLRYVAFSYLELERYSGSIDDFLNSAMVFLNSIPKQQQTEIREDFVRVLQIAHQIFGVHAFRKMVIDKKGMLDSRRRPINKALFEIWTRLLRLESEQNRKILVERRSQVIREFIRLCRNESFLNDLKGSGRNAVIDRIGRVERMIINVLK